MVPQPKAKDAEKAKKKKNGFTLSLKRLRHRHAAETYERCWSGIQLCRDPTTLRKHVTSDDEYDKAIFFFSFPFFLSSFLFSLSFDD